MKHLLAPSILSADFGVLKEQIEILNLSDADLIHIDVMDGDFVPNISFGFPIIDTIAKYSKKPLDIHLMIDEPDKYIERFAAYNPGYLTVHYEACVRLELTLGKIKSYNVKAGFAVNPDTPFDYFEGYFKYADLILIMSVFPGFGGQKFMPESIQRISYTRELINKMDTKLIIEVDGGINLQNIAGVVNAGAEIIVAGNSVFGSLDIITAIDNLKRTV
jgi:ribulose-phosphate 3-epimerase